MLKSNVSHENTSSILLAENGKNSSSKRTNHVSERYFFIKDIIEKGDMNLIFCPKSEMTTDFYTKPLQGIIFFNF